MRITKKKEKKSHSVQSMQKNVYMNAYPTKMEILTAWLIHGTKLESNAKDMRTKIW